MSKKVSVNTTANQYSMKNVAEILANPRNARTHPKSQIDKIAKSIQAFGFIAPAIIDKNGVLIAGHGRLEAAKQIGLEQIPCISADHLTEAQTRAYMLADNRIQLDSGWDDDLLKVELDELRGLDFDIGVTGFDAEELDLLFPPPVLEGEDEIPEVPAVPIARLGETWLLGPHRLRCGDSTNPSDVEVLLQGSVPHLMVTDPPYGVEYDASWRDKALGGKKGGRSTGTVRNDGEADWREAWALFGGDVAYIWHADLRAREVYESIESVGFNIRSQIIWAKNQFAIGRGDYHQKHEPCCYAVRNGAKGHWNSDRKQTTLWEIDKPQKSETGHSTQKPVECMRRPIVNNSQKGDLVYDPFLGSGTTVIAAETEGRVCYGMELNPAYADVIIERYQQFTGKKATRESDGAYFDNLKPAQEAA